MKLTTQPSQRPFCKHSDTVGYSCPEMALLALAEVELQFEKVHWIVTFISSSNQIILRAVKPPLDGAAGTAQRRRHPVVCLVRLKMDTCVYSQQLANTLGHAASHPSRWDFVSPPGILYL